LAQKEENFEFRSGWQLSLISLKENSPKDVSKRS
jgi:hypothetical protein